MSFDGQLFVRPEALPGLKKLTDAIHAEGAKASIQIGHCGNMTHYATCHCMPVSADTGFNLYSPTLHRRLKVSEIKALVRSSVRLWTSAAWRDSTAWRFMPDTRT